MMDIILPIVLMVVIVTFCAILGCLASCICFGCGIPCFSMWALWSHRKRQQQREGAYELVAVGEPYGRDGSTSRSRDQNENVAVAEAFLVSPLVAARVVQQQPSEFAGNTMDLETAAAPVGMVGFKDIWAYGLFVANLIVICYFAYTGSSTLRQIDIHRGPESSDLAVAADGLTSLIGLCISYLAIAMILGLLWLSVLLKHSHLIIEAVLKFNIFLFAVTAIWALFSGQLYGALFLGLTAAMNYWYYASVFSRIPFASAVLSSASQGIKDHFTGVMLSSFVTLLLQGVWVVLWSVAAFGIAVATRAIDTSTPVVSGGNGKHPQQSTPIIRDDDVDNLNGRQSVAFVFTLLSLYWGAEVLKYTLQTIVAGVVGVWYFQPDRKYAVRGSVFRAVTTSFGAVCFGSLLVSIVHTVREVFRLIQSKRNSRNRGSNRDGAGLAILFCLVDCLADMLERLLQYINRYAFCYVAAYGYGFIEAGTKVMTLFSNCGWANAVINDNLISNCLGLISLSISLIMGWVGYFIAWLYGDKFGIALHMSNNDGSVTTLLVILGAVIGAVVSMLLVTTLDSAVAMIYVCFAEDPDVLKVNHYEHYQRLSRTGAALFPNFVGSSLDAGNYPPVGQPYVPAEVYVPHQQGPMSYHAHQPIVGRVVTAEQTYPYQVVEPSAPPLPPHFQTQAYALPPQHQQPPYQYHTQNQAPPVFGSQGYGYPPSMHSSQKKEGYY